MASTLDGRNGAFVRKDCVKIHFLVERNYVVPVVEFALLKN